MRWILADDVEDELPADWDDLVDAAFKFVEQEATKARQAAQAAGKTIEEVEQAHLKGIHKAIGKRSSVWAKASAALKAASDGKCWYCEKKPARSDMPIDHFRPKAGVHEAAQHSGYWWLAFEWRNFRLSCTFCNSRRRDVVAGVTGGKQDYFPILEPPARQLSANDADDRPMLLDPLAQCPRGPDEGEPQSVIGMHGTELPGPPGFDVVPAGQPWAVAAVGESSAENNVMAAAVNGMISFIW